MRGKAIWGVFLLVLAAAVSLPAQEEKPPDEKTDPAAEQPEIRDPMLLEPGDPRFSAVSSRVFGTPHDVDVGALCRAYHVEARQIEVAELGAALGERNEGIRVLEVKADRSTLRQLHAAIRESL